MVRRWVRERVGGGVRRRFGAGADGFGASVDSRVWRRRRGQGAEFVGRLAFGQAILAHGTIAGGRCPSAS